MTVSEKLQQELSKIILHSIIFKRNLEKVKDILNCVIDINFLDIHGYSALHWAANYGFEEIPEFLIMRGADVNLRSSYNTHQNTPLILAAISGRNNISILLINNHADVNSKNLDGNTALHNVNSVTLDTIETLLKAKADVHATNSVGQVPLTTISEFAPADELNSIQDLFNKYQPPSKPRP